jgi:hypothetical protein
VFYCDVRAAADPKILIFPAWLPAVRAVMPDVTLAEISEMLNRRVRKLERENEDWMRKIRELS